MLAPHEASDVDACVRADLAFYEVILHASAEHLTIVDELASGDHNSRAARLTAT